MLPKWLWMSCGKEVGMTLTSEWPWWRMIWSSIRSDFATGLSFSAAAVLLSVDIQGWARTGVNNANIRNIVLIDQRAPEKTSQRFSSSNSWLGKQVVHRNLWRARTRKTAELSALLSDKNAWLELISESMNCGHRLTYHA